MADKMMRIAGRGSDGTAKAIKTDNIGNLGIVASEEVFEEDDVDVLIQPGQTYILGQSTQRNVNYNVLSGIIRFASSAETPKRVNLSLSLLNKAGTSVSPLLAKEFETESVFSKVIKLDIPTRSYTLRITNNEDYPIRIRSYSFKGTYSSNEVQQKNDPIEFDGKLLAKDAETGTDEQLTSVKDNDGNAILRTVDAAPRAYNSLNDSKRVEYLNYAELIKTRVVTLPDNYLEPIEVNVSKYKNKLIVLKSEVNQSVEVTVNAVFGNVTIQITTKNLNINEPVILSREEHAMLSQPLLKIEIEINNVNDGVGDIDVQVLGGRY